MSDPSDPPEPLEWEEPWDPKWGPPPPPQDGAPERFAMPREPLAAPAPRALQPAKGRGRDASHHASARRGSAGTRPPLVDAMALVLALQSVGYFFLTASAPQPGVTRGVTLVLSLALTFFFWAGHRWARLLLLVVTALSLLLALALLSSTLPLALVPLRPLLILSAVSDAFLLVGLFMPSVRAYFAAA